LNQQFYELIFKHCRSETGPYVVLRDIALLRYKSPTLIVSGDQLRRLDQELITLEDSKLRHPQTCQFREVCNKALSDGIALTISGDMYPELSMDAGAKWRPLMKHVSNSVLITAAMVCIIAALCLAVVTLASQEYGTILLIACGLTPMSCFCLTALFCRRRFGR
jgi:hypothetical protein